jgi:hypothetical protein
MGGDRKSCIDHIDNFERGGVKNPVIQRYYGDYRIPFPKNPINPFPPAHLLSHNEGKKGR